VTFIVNKQKMTKYLKSDYCNYQIRQPASC